MVFPQLRNFPPFLFSQVVPLTLFSHVIPNPAAVFFPLVGGVAEFILRAMRLRPVGTFSLPPLLIPFPTLEPVSFAVYAPSKNTPQPKNTPKPPHPPKPPPPPTFSHFSLYPRGYRSGFPPRRSSPSPRAGSGGLDAPFVPILSIAFPPCVSHLLPA